jgi:ABC-type nitrate/sulfonate/bicarbonate transport system permease component
MVILPVNHNRTLREGIILRLSVIVLFLVLWETVSRLEIVNPRLFPAPSTVWIALMEWGREGELWRDISASFVRMFFGYLIGAFLGVILGLFTGRSRLADRCISPLIQIFRPLPPVAIIPLVIVWLGIGNTAKIFSIAFAVFFPVWINAHIGASSIPRAYLWSAKILSKSRLKIMAKVLFPASMSAIIAGLRTSIAIAFIMVYVAEIAGSSSGIGYQISISHLAYRIDRMMAALFVLAAAGALSDYLFATSVHKMFPWTKSEQI